MTKNITLQEVSTIKNHAISLPCVLGRGKEADLSFPDATVSHRHALITEGDDKQIWIQDLKSANGVYVNKKKISDRLLIKEGDEIKVGKIILSLSPEADETLESTVILQSLGIEEKKSPDQERLQVIYDITGEFASDHDVASLGNKIFLKFKEIFKHDRGYIASVQEDGSLKPLCLCSIDESVPLSRSIIKRMLQSGESFILEDAMSDRAFKEEESIMALRVRSALCVPLIYNNQIYGLIYLDRNVPGAYKQEDLEFLRSIGSILAPLIENARLWSELQSRYADTVKDLKKTESRLIETERTAAYVKLAHAMAHEIRNPMMVIGSRVRKLAKTASDVTSNESFSTIIMSIDRIEKVLKEVDSFVKIPPPSKSLNRIDQIIQNEIEHNAGEWQGSTLHPSLHINTSHLMVPLDKALFTKAVSMVFRETAFSIPQDTDLDITISDRGNDIEVAFGELDENSTLCEPFDSQIRDKPWSLGLFLNIAHKILTEHGGRILLNPHATSAYPIVMRLPRKERI